MASEMDSIISGLKGQEAELQAVVDKLRAELGEAEANLGKIRDAVMVLESTPGKKPKKAASGSGRGKPKTPAATRDEVIKLIEKELTEKGVVAEELLKEAVYGAVVASGKNKLGLSLRFKEALADERFKQLKDGIKLA